MRQSRESSRFELAVGLFMLFGFLCLAWVSLKVARNEFFASDGYQVQAFFSNCSGLRRGASIMIAGVEIGRVKSITLEDYEAKVMMLLQAHVELQEDSIASIKTKGLIGEKFVEITPGGAEEIIGPWGMIVDTEPSLDIESLISKLVHGIIE